MPRLPSLETLAAPLFVLLWSTGFIGAKYGLPYAEPLTFLTLRFALVVPILVIWVILASAPWPTWQQVRESAVIGILLHGVYLGGVFQAIDWGIEAGLAALITGLQPVVTAFIAMLVLGDRLSRTQWIGMAAGLTGVTLVVGQKLGEGVGSPAGVMLCLCSVLAISLASILQKRWAGDHPRRSTAAVQFGAAFLFVGTLALLTEERQVEWTGDFAFALGWLVIVLSVGAISLLLALLKRDAAADVASLFFLVPASTALIAWAIFGETLGPLELLGVAVTAIGVLMVNQPHKFERLTSGLR